MILLFHSAGLLIHSSRFGCKRTYLCYRILVVLAASRGSISFRCFEAEVVSGSRSREDSRRLGPA